MQGVESKGVTSGVETENDYSDELQQDSSDKFVSMYLKLRGKEKYV